MKEMPISTLHKGLHGMANINEKISPCFRQEIGKIDVELRKCLPT